MRASKLVIWLPLRFEVAVYYAQWKQVLGRLEELDIEMAKPDLWEDAGRASQCSREHGALAGEVKGLADVEISLLEHVGLAELAHEENDVQVEGVSCTSLISLAWSIGFYVKSCSYLPFCLSLSAHETKGSEVCLQEDLQGKCTMVLVVVFLNQAWLAFQSKVSFTGIRF